MNPFKLSSRSQLVIAHDIGAALIAWLGAYLLRFNLALPGEFLHSALTTLVWVVPLQALLFWYFGLYRGIWRFASLPDLTRILKAVGVSAVAVPVILVLFRVEVVVPRSVLVLDPILLLLLMGGSRMAYRAWKEHRIAALLHPESKPVLVLGAGSAADFLLRELARNPSGYRVVGLLDDDKAKIGRQIQGVPVLGPLSEVQHWAGRMEVTDAILALPSAAHELRKQLSTLCDEAGLHVLTIPSLEDLMSGRVSVAQLRPIELDDLLGRDPVKLDDAGLHDFLGGRTVLVSGAGGSIGSELCRQIARFGPARLVLFENSELALYRMEQEFRQRYPALELVCAIGDVKDAARVDALLRQYRPHAIYHAAAYKHVPLMEEVNTLQALRNNILGTAVLARAAQAHGVGKFVMVSTDKAVNPTNVMGATKRLAEMVCQSLSPSPDRPLSPAGGEGSTRFVSVRFGNVLGSSGSVIPKFQEQIEAGGPLTVTHPDITRYFMSIPEAAQLVLQAGLMGQGGEIFVLDMGEPVRIADLARLMIRLAGRTEEEIRIVYSGLRPGEKLYEELLADEEGTLATPHPKLRVARARVAESGLVTEVLEWVAAAEAAEDGEVRERLQAWLPEYHPAVHSAVSSPSTSS